MRWITGTTSWPPGTGRAPPSQKSFCTSITSRTSRSTSSIAIFHPFCCQHLTLYGLIAKSRGNLVARVVETLQNLQVMFPQQGRRQPVHYRRRRKPNRIGDAAHHVERGMLDLYDQPSRQRLRIVHRLADRLDCRRRYILCGKPSQPLGCRGLIENAGQSPAYLSPAAHGESAATAHRYPQQRQNAARLLHETPDTEQCWDGH